jgi:hypothetical protein
MTEYLNATDVELLLSRGIAVKKYMNRVPSEVEIELRYLYKDYADRLAERLSKFFKADIEGELISLDELTYSEYVMSIGDPGRLYTFRLPPMEGLGLLDVNSNLFRNLLKLKAGKDIADEENDEKYKLSKSELNVFKKLSTFILKELCVSHKLIEKHSFKLCEFIYKPYRLKTARSSDVIFLLTFELTHEKFSGLFGICLPLKMLQRCFLTKVPIDRSCPSYEDRIEENCLRCKLLSEFLEKHKAKNKGGEAGEETDSHEETDSSDEDKASGVDKAELEQQLDLCAKELDISPKDEDGGAVAG